MLHHRVGLGRRIALIERHILILVVVLNDVILSLNLPCHGIGSLRNCVGCIISRVAFDIRALRRPTCECVGVLVVGILCRNIAEYRLCTVIKFLRCEQNAFAVEFDGILTDCFVKLSRVGRVFSGFGDFRIPALEGIGLVDRSVLGGRFADILGCFAAFDVCLTENSVAVLPRDRVSLAVPDGRQGDVGVGLGNVSARLIGLALVARAPVLEGVTLGCRSRCEER